MLTRKNAQLYSVSTAGTEKRSPYLWSKVTAGRQAVEAGITSGICYLEWSPPEDADPSLPETWRQACPALGVTIDEATVRGDFHGMPRHEFLRSMLNTWTSAMGEAVISLDVWEGLAEPTAPRPETLILGIDVSPKSKAAAIAAAGVHDGHLIVSVLEHGPGTEWLAPRLEAMKGEMGGALTEVLGDRKALAPVWDQLEHLGVVEVDTGEAAEATSYFLDVVERGLIRHRGEKELTVALDGAALRPLGDSFAWSRKGSGVDISPLCAVTAAVFGWRWDGWAGDKSE
jgi:phage terminase large subunit-like protein